MDNLKMDSLSRLLQVLVPHVHAPPNPTKSRLLLVLGMALDAAGAELDKDTYTHKVKMLDAKQANNKPESQ